MGSEQTNNASIARNIDEMKAEIRKELPENLKKELEIKLKNEKTEKIFWSVRERDKFVRQLKAEIKDNKSAEGILNLIKNEIDNEFAENKFDEAAKNYEGFDLVSSATNSNKIRKIIEKSWETNTQGLSAEQKTQLQKNVADRLKAAYKNKWDKIPEKIKEDSSEYGVVEEEEAKSIAEFIKTEATNMRDANKNETKANEPENPETPEAIITAAQAKLRKNEIEDWANEKDPNGEFKKPNEENLKTVKEHGGEDLKAANEKVEAFAKNLGLNPETAKIALENLIALNTKWFRNATNQTTLATNLKSFETRFSTEVQKKQLGDFFKLKGVEKWQDNPDWLVRYFAFNNVAEDLKDFDKLIQARETKKNAGEIVPPIEVAQQQVEVVVPKQDQASPEEKLQQASASFEQAIKAANGRDYLSAFRLLTQSIKSFFGAIGAWTKSIWREIPPGLEEVPIIGGLVKWIQSSGKAAEEKDAAVAAAPNLAPEQTPEQNPEEKILNDFLGPNAKSKGLEKVTMKKFLADNANLEAFANAENTGIEKTQLEKLRQKLLGKTDIAILKTEEKNVFVFLREQLKEKPEYLA